MDYLKGLPMDYPKWTTLKFVANINLRMLEPEQKMRSIDKHHSSSPQTRSIGVVHGLGVNEMYQPYRATFPHVKAVLAKRNR